MQNEKDKIKTVDDLLSLYAELIEKDGSLKWTWKDESGMLLVIERRPWATDDPEIVSLFAGKDILALIEGFYKSWNHNNKQPDSERLSLEELVKEYMPAVMLGNRVNSSR